MKKYINIIMFAVASIATALGATLDVGQVIHIDVKLDGKLVVEGKAASIATLTPIVNSIVKDREHTAVELKIPEKLDQATSTQVMDACRKAGISRFTVVKKPAGAT